MGPRTAPDHIKWRVPLNRERSALAAVILEFLADKTPYQSKQFVVNWDGREHTIRVHNLSIDDNKKLCNLLKGWDIIIDDIYWEPCYCAVNYNGDSSANAPLLIWLERISKEPNEYTRRARENAGVDERREAIVKINWWLWKFSKENPSVSNRYKVDDLYFTIQVVGDRRVLKFGIEDKNLMYEIYRNGRYLVDPIDSNLEESFAPESEVLTELVRKIISTAKPV